MICVCAHVHAYTHLYLHIHMKLTKIRFFYIIDIFNVKFSVRKTIVRNIVTEQTFVRGNKRK